MKNGESGVMSDEELKTQHSELKTPDSGIYTLHISVDKLLCIHIGALGPIHFSPGIYVYVGSAKRELNARIARHLRKEKKLHWHIDYLLATSGVKIVEVKKYFNKKECELSKEIEAKADSSVKHFGCSDCHCESHLFLIKKEM